MKRQSRNSRNVLVISSNSIPGMPLKQETPAASNQNNHNSDSRPESNQSTTNRRTSQEFIIKKSQGGSSSKQLLKSSSKPNINESPKQTLLRIYGGYRNTSEVLSS